MSSTTQRTRKTLTLLVATVVALSAIAGFAGFAGAATTTDLTVSITDDDNTINPDETTTVEIAVASADGGVGAAELGVELSDPGVATITDVSVLHSPGNTDNAVAGGGGSADVKYAFADSPDDESVTILEVTLQAGSPGSTNINVVENSQTGNLVVFDENGAGYTLDTVGSATLTVNEQPVAVAAATPETVTEGETMTLDASASNDPDQGDSLTYLWEQTSGPDVTLSDDTAVAPTFTAPDVSEETELLFLLTVEDEFGAIATTTVDVTVQPSEPAAANFQVSDLEAPDSATQGDEIDVSAEVENTGGQAATKSVEFRVDANDDGFGDSGDVVLSRDVELDPGEFTTVEFPSVDTSGLAPGTYTHGVVTPGDSATAQITIDPTPSAEKETTVSLQPAEQTGAVGVETTYDVVVDSAQGGVGAGEIAVSVDDTNVATIEDVEVLNGAVSEDLGITDSMVEFEYFGADTAQTDSVTVATVTVEGAGADTTGLSIGAADGNNDVLLFDEEGNPYDVTDTTGATLEVLPAQFSVDSTSAPEKAAVGSTVTVTGTVNSDGDVESTQTVELLFDLNNDGTAETVDSQQVTIGANGQTQVSFDVQVPADASFGDRSYEIVTAADSAGGTIEFTPPAVNEEQDLPNDPDDDGLYEDVNGNGDLDTGDAQSLFSNRDDDAVESNVGAFDFNGDGVVNVGDAQALFDEVVGSA